MGVALGIIKKSGAFFYYKDNRLAQGKENAKKAIEDSPELFDELDNAIRGMSDQVDFTENEFELDEGLDDENEFDIRTLEGDEASDE